MRGEKARLLLAFAAIYIIWGSTYLGIRYAIETIPPFFMIGSRAFLAGCLIYGWARLRGAPSPSGGQWARAVLVGVLLFAGGQGMLAYAMTRVPSGASALVIGTIPLWMTLLQAFREDRSVLGGRVITGLVLGFAGVAILVEPLRIMGGQPLDPLGTGVLLFAALSWAIGSVIGRHASLPKSVSLTTGMTLLTGSALLLAGSLLGGEAREITTTVISARSWGGFFYQVIFGSIIAFGCYTWLMRVSTPSRVSTYAFVNPLVAVFLGWTLGSEALNMRVGAATVLMVGAVALITTATYSVGRKAEDTATRAGNAPGRVCDSPELEPEEA